MPRTFLKIGHVKVAIGAVEDEEVKAVGRSQIETFLVVLTGLET
jgi:hypothetical protein